MMKNKKQISNQIENLRQIQRNAYRMRDKEAEKLLNKPRKETIMQFTVDYDEEFPALD